MRSALAAALVVAVASVLTGVALVIAAHLILVDNVDEAASQRAVQIAATIDQTGGADLTGAVASSPHDRTVVQVIDPSGNVVATSPAVAGIGPMSQLRPAAGRVEREDRRLDQGHQEVVHVVATGAGTPQGVYTVLVGQSMDEIDDGTEAAGAALIIGLPLLTIVVGVATFLFVGRTLRPVEAMRRQAATISVSNLHTRLPVPTATDEIAALATTMNTMLDRIEAASGAQHRFVADASHELRSPLATIHAGLDLLGNARLPADASTHVARMRRESARMGRLIDDLLLLARVDESGLRLRREQVDLDDVVYAERDRITAERPDLRVDALVTPVRVVGDAHHLQRVLRNLVDNAARHAHRTVAISLVAHGDEAELVVRDDGPGIPDNELDRVFDRFVRLDEDRSRLGGGAGLGLPIAREIVTAHGGTLTAERTQGGGAGLRIRLPVER